MIDSRKKSMFETLLDVGVGLIVSTVLNFIVLPPMADGIKSMDLSVMLWISLIFTGFAVVRRYAMRRFFESRRSNV